MFFMYELLDQRRDGQHDALTHFVRQEFFTISLNGSKLIAGLIGHGNLAGDHNVTFRNSQNIQQVSHLDLQNDDRNLRQSNRILVYSGGSIGWNSVGSHEPYLCHDPSEYTTRFDSC